MAGRIILAATPIGNFGDASSRLREALGEADTIAAEDTRRLRDLARRLGVTINGTVIAVHDHNERDRAVNLVAKAAEGEVVLVVTDAGMPTVSDPGFRIVEAAIAAGIDVTVFPGPSAVLAALAVSGLPSDRFSFEGFPPRTVGQRARFLGLLRSERRTMVFFESPRRLAGTLAAMVEAFGLDRRVVVARELTKTHEEVRRGTLGDLTTWAETRTVLGEVVIVVAGELNDAPSLAILAEEAESRAEAGERLKDVIADIAGARGVGARDLYREVLARREEIPTEPRQ